MIRSLFGLYTITDYLLVSRTYAHLSGFRKELLKILLRKIGTPRGLCIENFNNIGSKLFLPHGLNIIINPDVVIGNDCTIYQGVTLGVVGEGKRKGCPTLEDRVVVGPNAVVVGGITVGHDTIIAGNSFVNFDVPPHSIVIGNPGIIHRKK